MVHAWKVPHVVKGMLTYVPALNARRIRRAATGGSNSPRYCYAVWLRHLVVLDRFGFSVKDAAIGELGPGDSVGTGLAALLSGAAKYVGLDVVGYSLTADLESISRELGQLYLSRAPIPDDSEFPAVRPRLDSYDFPDRLVVHEDLAQKIGRINSAVRSGLTDGVEVAYHAPWTSPDIIQPGSLDLVFSQAVLQYVDDLSGTYRAMFSWLRPGGYCSHATGLGANDFSPSWNGHWAYSDFEWRLVRGRRECLLNRQPLSVHLQLARSTGFDILHVDAQHNQNGLPVHSLSSRFRALAAEDLVTSGAMFVLRKPLHPQP
jgi:SAM-dependent methyltransferase